MRRERTGLQRNQITTARDEAFCLVPVSFNNGFHGAVFDSELSL